MPRGYFHIGEEIPLRVTINNQSNKRLHFVRAELYNSEMCYRKVSESVNEEPVPRRSSAVKQLRLPVRTLTSKPLHWFGVFCVRTLPTSNVKAPHSDFHRSASQFIPVPAFSSNSSQSS